MKLERLFKTSTHQYVKLHKVKVLKNLWWRCIKVAARNDEGGRLGAMASGGGLVEPM